MVNVETAWDEGFRARLAGKHLEANPYHPLTAERHKWSAGWRDQNEHLNDCDEALASIGWFG